MHRIREFAQHRRVRVLTADVSRMAKPLCLHFGFVAVELRLPLVRGLAVPNALLRKDL
jgi:putative acetyltransferase